jgi:hypothetical protein
VGFDHLVRNRLRESPPSRPSVATSTLPSSSALAATPAAAAAAIASGPSDSDALGLLADADVQQLAEIPAVLREEVYASFYLFVDFNQIFTYLI